MHFTVIFQFESLFSIVKQRKTVNFEPAENANADIRTKFKLLNNTLSDQ